jgi:hypothetical protein
MHKLTDLNLHYLFFCHLYSITEECCECLLLYSLGILDSSTQNIYPCLDAGMQFIENINCCWIFLQFVLLIFCWRKIKAILEIFIKIKKGILKYWSYDHFGQYGIEWKNSRKCKRVKSKSCQDIMKIKFHFVRYFVWLTLHFVYSLYSK